MWYQDIEEKRQEYQVPLFSKICYEWDNKNNLRWQILFFICEYCFVISSYRLHAAFFFITLKKLYLLSFAYFSKGYGARK